MMKKIGLFIKFSILSFAVLGQKIDTTKKESRFQLFYRSAPMRIPDLSLDTFVQYHGYEFMFGIDSCIRDKNFVRPKIDIGAQKRINIFRIIQPVSSEDCVTFIKNHSGILPSAYGLITAYILIGNK